MSQRYLGGFITANPVQPSSTSAKGSWTLQQQMQANAAGNWPVVYPSDPYFDYVSLLLDGNGTNGAQNNTFLDSSTNNFTITRNGNTTQGSFSPYGDLWSNYFNGSDAYITALSSGTWNISASNNSSFETWVYISTTGVQSVLCGSLNRWWLGYNFTDVGATANKFSFSVFNGSSWQTISSSTTPTIGTWYHVAATFDTSGNTVLYVNGVQEASASGVTPNTTTGVLYIGAVLNPGYSYGLNGYLSNVRIIKGGALVYTGNFTPSTSPLTLTVNTVMLTCQSNRFIDQANFPLTVYGATSVQRFSPFNPTAEYSTSVIGGSGYFPSNGSGAVDNSYPLRIPNNSAFNLSGDFTVESWVYVVDTTPNGNSICIIGSDYGVSINEQFGISSTFDAIYAYHPSTGVQSSSTLVGIPKAWNHCAFVRSGSTLKMYFNGVQVGSFSNSVTYTYANGAFGSLGGYSSTHALGYACDLRICNGTALYTTNFTPPTAPITAVSGTTCLLSFQNAGISDLAMQNNLETVGNAQVSTSVKKYGSGSLYFDGSSQLNYLSPVFGGGDFTVECWVYFNSTSGNQAIFGINFNSNANSLSAVRVDISGGVFRFMGSTDGTSFYFFQATSTSPSTSTWYHIALVRSSGTVTFYVNGTSAGSVSSVPNTLYAGTGGSRIGNIVYSSNYYLNGYIDDFRITAGYARYTANFTPPTAALPTY